MFLFPGQSSYLKSLFDSVQISEVPAFQFMAKNSDQYVRLSSIPANPDQTALDRETVRLILVPHDNKARVGHAPAAQFSSKLILQILFALKDQVANRYVIGQDSGEKVL